MADDEEITVIQDNNEEEVEQQEEDEQEAEEQPEPEENQEEVEAVQEHPPEKESSAPALDEAEHDEEEVKQQTEEEGGEAVEGEEGVKEEMDGENEEAPPEVTGNDEDDVQPIVDVVVEEYEAEATQYEEEKEEEEVDPENLHSEARDQEKLSKGGRSRNLSFKLASESGMEMNGEQPTSQHKMDSKSQEAMMLEGGEITSTEEMEAVENMFLPSTVAKEEEDKRSNRETLLDRIHDALKTNSLFKHKYDYIDVKLANHLYLAKKTTSGLQFRTYSDPNNEMDRFVAQVGLLMESARAKDGHLQDQKEYIKKKIKRKLERVEVRHRKLNETMKKVTLGAILQQSGKSVPPKDIEQIFANYESKTQKLVQIRLDYILLKNEIHKMLGELRSKEEFAEGLNLIDFELLKIENETCNEKIEERVAELVKLRKKNSSTIQVLTHLKEKLKFVQRENLEKKNLLKEVEASVCQSRIVLSRTKHARDSLRQDNEKLRNNSGLIGHRPLLHDFACCVDEKDVLKKTLEQLQQRHASLTTESKMFQRLTESLRKK